MNTLQSSDSKYCAGCTYNKNTVAKKALLTRAVLCFSLTIFIYFSTIVGLCLGNYEISISLMVAGVIPFAYGISSYIKYKTFKGFYRITEKPAENHQPVKLIPVIQS